MNELGLVFGTVDLRVTDDNEYVFLEVNPQGQFLYVEILTGMPITAALAEFLAGA
jgi:biotin carboxylase